MFECVRATVSSFYEYKFIVKLPVSQSEELLLDTDSFLKYLGLQGFLLVALNHLWALLEG